MGTLRLLLKRLNDTEGLQLETVRSEEMCSSMMMDVNNPTG